MADVAIALESRGRLGWVRRARENGRQGSARASPPEDGRRAGGRSLGGSCGDGRARQGDVGAKVVAVCVLDGERARMQALAGLLDGP